MDWEKVKVQERQNPESQSSWRPCGFGPGRRRVPVPSPDPAALALTPWPWLKAGPCAHP